MQMTEPLVSLSTEPLVGSMVVNTESGFLTCRGTGVQNGRQQPPFNYQGVRRMGVGVRVG